MDFKLQTVRGITPGDWDQRKSIGEFEGSLEGVHVATIGEFRDTSDLADLLTNPDRVAEFIAPGDNALMVLNKIADKMTEKQPDTFGLIASVFRLGGSGPVHLQALAYDND